VTSPQTVVIELIIRINVMQASENSRAKAASMKMFGKLTRDTVEWHPDKLLCKRFNIANPYPEYVVQFSLLLVLLCRHCLHESSKLII